MKFKKLIAVILSAVLAMSMLAGCVNLKDYSDITNQISQQLAEGKTDLDITIATW